MIVIPAIDLRGGKVVRLKHGDPAAATVYDDDPIAVAEQFAADGAQIIHVVDLDAALGDGDNKTIIRGICERVGIGVQTGGGLRSMEAISAVLGAGAERAVLGTAAALDAPLLADAVQAFGERIVVALDVKGDRVMIKGWKEDAGALDDLLPRLTGQQAPRFLITQISVDGTMEGPDFDLYTHAMTLTDKPIIASGGVGTLANLETMTKVGVEAVIVGKAIYEGTIKLAEVLAS